MTSNEFQTGFPDPLLACFCCPQVTIRGVGRCKNVPNAASMCFLLTLCIIIRPKSRDFIRTKHTTNIMCSCVTEKSCRKSNGCAFSMRRLPNRPRTRVSRTPLCWLSYDFSGNSASFNHHRDIFNQLKVHIVLLLAVNVQSADPHVLFFLRIAAIDMILKVSSSSSVQFFPSDRQRKDELEQRMSTLQESRRELMVQLEQLMMLLKVPEMTETQVSNTEFS